MMTQKKIGLFSLVMLITGAIDSIRNLPTTALFGSTLIFFFVLSAIVFLIPASLVAADLGSTLPEEEGVYAWVKKAFGERVGFIAIWLQWINTMVWYPTILSFIAGTAAYLVNPHLAESKGYLVAVILVVFWALTLLNLKGIQVSARFAATCAVIGMVIPMILIVVLGAIWCFSGKPLQVHLTLGNMLPHLNQGESWISLTAIMTAFVGIELTSVHIRSVDQPKTVFPKAMLYSVLFILLTMVLGSLSIAYTLPKSQIGLVSGIMQEFTLFFQAYHLQWMVTWVTLMLVIGSVGEMVNWVISPAKGLLRAGQLGYLPRYLCQENQSGVAGRLLVLQAILVSVLCTAFMLMPSINGSYWLLTDLSTQLYMLMYVLMFLAAWWIRRRQSITDEHAFRVPGGKCGMAFVCLLGLVGCVLTLWVGFLPPSNIDVGGRLNYEVTFSFGILLMLAPVLIFFAYKYFNQNDI